MALNRADYGTWHELARKLYDAGMNDTQIGQQCGVYKGAVAHWRNKHGLKVNPTVRKTIEHDWYPKAQCMYAQGRRDHEIASACKTSIQKVRYWRKKNGLPAIGPVTTHGACSRNRKLLVVWNGMVNRCENANSTGFVKYGERGITVCDEWHNPNAFIDWALTHGYKQGLQIDRIDNDGPYAPWNCRWATPKENCRNRQHHCQVEINGTTKPLIYWVEKYGKSYTTAYGRFRRHGIEALITYLESDE